MVDAAQLDAPLAVAAVALVATLLYAAYRDLQVREVDDDVWLLAAVAGAAIGLIPAVGEGGLAVVAWLLVSGLVIEHLVPWDAALAVRRPRWPGFIEIGVYAAVTLGLVAIGLTGGLGPAGLPIAALATWVSVLVARGLFEVGVLYGGADAKAVMVAGLLLPLDASPLFGTGGPSAALLASYPFTLTLLVNAALAAVVVPIALAVRNATRGEFRLPQGFTSYRMPVAELPHRFVWIRDPAVPSAEDEAETSEEDRAIRERLARELAARGVTSVWVTPQLPFVVFLAAGAIAGILFGNLLFDLFAVL
ncbi:MAG TPA: A24 family peptidase C-terminal domain-containing protein [Thermoplasmata archaeon]|nr:A24 family peptidase C-terminal domain-containing protein [Thermoplasmata archaeon]